MTSRVFSTERRGQGVIEWRYGRGGRIGPVAPGGPIQTRWPVGPASGFWDHIGVNTACTASHR